MVDSQSRCRHTRLPLSIAIGRVLATCAAAAMPSLAKAEDRPAAGEVTVTGEVALLSDYVARGVTQTEGRPALQASVTVERDGIYVGGWASNVRFEGDAVTDLEIDLLAGVRRSVAGVDVNLEAALYLYPDQPARADYDYGEVIARLSRKLGRLELRASGSWAPDFFGSGATAWSAEAGAAVQASRRLTLAAGFARQWSHPPFESSSRHVAAQFALGRQLVIEARFVDARAPALRSIAGRRLVAGIRWRI